ncbi:MAG TPA: carboxypeptidase-like regulatory domain-containing protein [Candidatus Acidoferrum sp.]|nr:carboxypeptidase-like regulatory domain-containing protein [Candidatus Acidoferrum sp.]
MKGEYTSEMSTNRLALKRFVTGALIVLAALFLVLPVAHAQITGTITGTVYDNSGAVVPGASVSLINEASKDVRGTVSDSAGYFAFPGVLPGNYTVKVEMKGFKTFEQSNLVLQASDKRNVNATLTVGQTTETVTVEARTDLVPVDSPARALDLTATDFNRLPMVTRNAAELLRTLPGAVTVGAGSTNGANSSMDFSGVGAAGSSVGNGVSISGVPYRGGTALLMDGTNILDEGCDCTSISVPNPDMVQEVKVQTSAFGADSSKGPVVINFLTKSGGADYHGEGYLYTRNAIFNSDSWQLNHQGQNVATGDHYYYPGGNFGGPVPGTKKKLQFWAGYEHFYQLATGGTNLFSYIPTPDMLAGNFSGTAANNALCQADLGLNADSTASKAAGTYCYDPTTGRGPGNTAIGSAAAVPVDPGATALWKLMPQANANPATTPGGYNYFYPVPALHNGYVFRGRGDYSFDENNKLFVTYQYSADSQPSDGDAHMWWLPGNSVVFPGGGLSNPTQTKNITGNFLHVFSPTLTNQMTGFWTYYNSPQSPANFNAVLRSTVGYPASYGTIFAKTLPLPQTMVPGWNQAGNYTFPDFSQWDVFSGSGGSYYIRKENPAFADDLTKVFKNHTFKAGFYFETTGNNQGNFNPINGGFSFGSSSTSYPDAVTGLAQGTQNPTANFMMGIASQYNEQSSLPLNDQAYKTFAFYGMDSWKVTRRFTADFGMRFEHIGHWYDRDGYGNAVWVPGDVVSDVLKGKVFPGIEWHGIDPGIPLSGTPNRLLHFEPRAGIAYDIFGTGETVIRGGWGVYMFGDQVNDYSNALALAQQSIGTALPSNTTVLFSETGLLPKPSQVFASPSSGASKILNPNDYDVSWTQNWNFTIDQRLPWNSHLEVAYEGNNSGALNLGGQVENGSNLAGGDYININKTPLGAFFGPDPFTGVTATDPENVCGTAGQCTANGLADYRPWGVINLGTSGSPKLVNVYGTNGLSVDQHAGYANYNALEVIWSKQTGRFTFNTSFLWSKALGFGTGDINPFVLRANYVVLSIDRPYVWNSSYSYALGRAYTGDNKVIGGAANGWTIAGFTTWQKGPDLQSQTSENLGLNFQYSYNDPVLAKTVTAQLSQRSFYGTDANLNVQPIETCNPTGGLGDSQFAKLSCFAAPGTPTGTPSIPDIGLAASPYTLAAFGPTQLPYISMAPFFDSDIALYKTFHITERHTIEFRMTATNWLNHPLPGFSNNNPVTLKYALDPGNKSAGYTYIGSTAASAWGFTDTKNEPSTNAYGRVLQWGLKYSF